MRTATSILAACSLALGGGCAATEGGDSAPPGQSVLDEHVAPDEIASKSQSLSVANCGYEQQLYLGWVIIEAQKIARNGRDWARQAPNDPWLTQWFGTPPDANVNTTLRNVASAIDNGSFDLLCDDGHGSCIDHYARAQGERTVRTVRICDAFWDLSLSDMILTFLHEMSHHHGAPNDRPSSAASCERIAKLFPDEASKSGYCYEAYYSGWAP
jgi:hypothetical protein